MKFRSLLCLRILLFFALIASGISTCDTFAAPPTNSEKDAWIQGKVEDLEDGQLVLRLANGKTRSFGFDANVAPEKEVIKSKGRKCRIKINRIWEETPAYAMWVDLITHFEWLEPLNARSKPVYLHNGPQSATASEKVSASSLVGYWETGNINEPFNEKAPKLSLRFFANGELIADEDSNRERRGKWTLVGEEIIEAFSNARHANRILEFNKMESSMLLKYEIYDNKPLRLKKVD